MEATLSPQGFLEDMHIISPAHYTINLKNLSGHCSDNFHNNNIIKHCKTAESNLDATYFS